MHPLQVEGEGRQRGQRLAGVAVVVVGRRRSARRPTTARPDSSPPPSCVPPGPVARRPWSRSDHRSGPPAGCGRPAAARSAGPSAGPPAPRPRRRHCSEPGSRPRMPSTQPSWLDAVFCGALGGRALGGRFLAVAAAVFLRRPAPSSSPLPSWLAAFSRGRLLAGRLRGSRAVEAAFLAAVFSVAERFPAALRVGPRLDAGSVSGATARVLGCRSSPTDGPRRSRPARHPACTAAAPAAPAHRRRRRPSDAAPR